MSDYAIYSNIKMLSSFISRREVTGVSTKIVARSLLLKLRGQIPSTHRTLQAVGGEIRMDIPGIDPGLYKCFYQYLRILIHDKNKGNPRHECTRSECQMYCILPMYARRCLSDTNVQILFQHLQNIIEENGSLLASTGRTTESKSAINIFRYAISLDHPSLYDSYDVLLAMSGHNGTILNPIAKVDSKLYELIFDLIRSNDYERHDESYMPSLPWLNTEESFHFKHEFRDVIQQAAARNIENRLSQVSNLPSSPTAVPDRSLSRVSPVLNNTGASRLPPSMTDYRVPSAQPAVTDSSASPPSYGSVIVTPPSTSHDTDDGLPTYHHVLLDIVERSKN